MTTLPFQGSCCSWIEIVLLFSITRISEYLKLTFVLFVCFSVSTLVSTLQSMKELIESDIATLKMERGSSITPSTAVMWKTWRSTFIWFDLWKNVTSNCYLYELCDMIFCDKNIWIFVCKLKEFVCFWYYSSLTLKITGTCYRLATSAIDTFMNKILCIIQCINIYRFKSKLHLESRNFHCQTNSWDLSLFVKLGFLTISSFWCVIVIMP